MEDHRYGNEDIPNCAPTASVPPRPGWAIYETMSGGEAMTTVSHDDGERSFLLTNRSFELMGAHLNHLFLALLLKKRREVQRTINVMDVGGGVNSTCVRGMLAHPVIGHHLHTAINVDLFARELAHDFLARDGVDSSHFAALNDDIMRVPLTDATIDAAVSYQMLDSVPLSRMHPTLHRIAMLLSPGGEAYLEESRLTHAATGGWIISPRTHLDPRNPAWHWLIQIAQQTSVCIAPYRVGNRSMLWMGKWDPQRAAFPVVGDLSSVADILHKAAQMYALVR